MWKAARVLLAVWFGWVAGLFVGAWVAKAIVYVFGDGKAEDISWDLVLALMIVGPVAGAYLVLRPDPPPLPVEPAAVTELARRLDQIGEREFASKLRLAADAQHELTIRVRGESAIVRRLLSQEPIPGLERVHHKLEHDARISGETRFSVL
jgi:hypothetical protein